MIRLLVRGRLGNQLFQYAAVRAQAKRLGVAMEIDLFLQQQETPGTSPPFWLETLPIQARVIRYPAAGLLRPDGVVTPLYRRFIHPALWTTYVEPASGQDADFRQIRPWTLVLGYFQSLFYLIPRDDDILAELNLWPTATADAVDYAREIEEAGFVSVHVRRGDYLHLPAYQGVDYHAYITAALDLFRKKLVRPKFLVFSDEPSWCKQSGLFASDCEFVEPNRFSENPAVDLLFMSRCAHHIIANSSYSWWAAWSTNRRDKICVLPKKWLADFTAERLGLVDYGWNTL